MRNNPPSLSWFARAWLPVLFYLALPPFAQAQMDGFRYVNPFIGTSVSEVPTRWGNEGGCYPGAAAISGYFQMTPETRHSSMSGYDFRDSSILIFSCLHHNSGFPGGSAGNLYVMPLGRDSGFVPLVTRRSFRHAEEAAEPGYYRVRLTDDGTEIETTASPRAGLFRIRFHKGSIPRLYIGDAGELTATNTHTLSGGRFNLQAQFQPGFTSCRIAGDGVVLSFPAGADSITEIDIRLAASPAGIGSSASNLEEEAPLSVSFDSVKIKTGEAWRKALSLVSVNDPDGAGKTIFYTALYHSLLVPWVISDRNGNYLGRDGQLHHSAGQAEYANFSPWDTYRTLNPLRALLFPEIEKDVALSMYDIYTQTGRLPVESMTGNHAIAILADDYVRGLLPVDRNNLFLALQSNTTDSPFVQRDMPAYINNGYLSAAWPESVTRTVEYGYDDWVLSEFARNSMHDEKAATKYQLRSMAYRKLFDPRSRLLLPREENQFLDHAGTTGYKEGDAWVYSYNVPQDTKGLSNLMGGDESFARRLDSALRDGRICFDNETVFHVPWLFNEARAPAKTQYWVDRLRRERFHDSPGGLPGNDDLGSASAWYVWSALGFYPLTPGRPLYSVAAPLFTDLSLTLPDGKTLRLRRTKSGAYVKSIRRNDTLFAGFAVPQKTLAEGGEWAFEMDSVAVAENPSTAGAASHVDAYPFSVTKTGSDIRISSPTLSAGTVRPDEPFQLRFTATNLGAFGGDRIIVFAGKEETGRIDLLLDSGESRIATVTFRAYRPGKTGIRIGDQLLPLTVSLPAKDPLPGYRISQLHARSIVPVGKKQTYSFSVKNTGGRETRFRIPVILNGMIAGNSPVTLEPGESKEMTGSLDLKKTGVQQLQIGGRTFPFRVYRSPAESLLMDLKWSAKSVSGKDSGIMKDRSGFDSDGKLVKARVRTGRANADAVTVGEGDYVALASAPGLDDMDSNLTMMAWIRPEKNAPGLADIFSKGDHHVLQLSGSGQLTFFAGGWGRGDCTIKLPSDWTGRWHHVAGVCQGRSLTLYLDGREAGKTITDEPVNLSTGNHWNLGRNEEFPGIRMFNGSLNYVRVYAEALTAEEVWKEMERERPKP